MSNGNTGKIVEIVSKYNNSNVYDLVNYEAPRSQIIDNCRSMFTEVLENCSLEEQVEILSNIVRYHNRDAIVTIQGN